MRGPDGPFGAISLVGGADAALERLAPALLQAARAVSGELHGYLRPAAPDPSAGGHPVRQRLPQMSITSVEG